MSKHVLGVIGFIILLITLAHGISAQGDTNVDPPTYKGFDKGECTYYAAREFDKVAPNPAPNFFWRGNAGSWFQNAADKGWATSRNPRDAEVNAIIVWNEGGPGHVAIVSHVQAQTIDIKEVNWTEKFNEVTSANLPFTNLDRGKKGKYKFTGYIFPRKLGTPTPVQTASPPAFQRFDLNGEWTVTGYPGVDQIKVRIRQDGDKVGATKLTSGSSSVPSGEVTWFGTYTSSRFFGKIQAADNGFTNTRWIEIVIKVLDKTHIEVTMLDSDPVSGQRWGPLRFEKVSN